MEENVSWGVQQLRCKTAKFRSEKRDNFYKSMFSLKRTPISASNTRKDNDNLVYKPLENHQIQEWTLRIKQRVEEIIQAEKEFEIPKLTNLVFLLLQDLKSTETPDFSQQNLIETNFLSIYRVIMSNKDYWNSDDLSYDLTWCFSILITNSELTFQFLMEQKVIDYLFFLLQKGRMKLQSMCCYSLANLITLHKEVRDYALELGIIKYICSFYSSDNVPRYLFDDIMSLANSIVREPLPPYEKVKPLLPLLTEALRENLLKDMEKENIVETLDSLVKLANGPQNQINDLIAYNVHHKCIDLCLKSNINEEIGKFSLRVLGNLMTGDNETSEKVVEAGLLKLLDIYYETRDISDEKVLEISWILSNVLACGELIEKVMRSPIFDYLFKIPMRNKHSKFFQEGCQIIFNVSKIANFNQLLKMPEKGLIELMEFEFEAEDPEVLVNLCKALKKILKKELEFSRETKQTNYFREEFERKGIDKKLRELFTHENNRVFYHAELALSFLETE